MFPKPTRKKKRKHHPAPIVDTVKDLKLAYYLTIANTGDERLDAIYKNVGDTLDRAIEIINRNGV